MGTGYVRNDVSNNIASGNIINASDLDGEFDAIVAAFSAVTGHTHDGTAAEGAPITVLGPSQDFVGGISDFSPKLDSTYDLGKTGTRWANAYIDSLTLTTDLAVVDGGTGASTAAAARTNLGVAIGTDVQAYDAGLQSISGLTTAADTMIYTTALDTYATTSLTPFARTLLDDTNAVSARATLGAAIGTNVQAWDANLDQIAALTPTDSNFIVGNGSAWVAESGATVRTSLGLGSMATQDSSSVSITGGSISGATISTSSATITGGSVTGITDLAIADGGTGASTASGARTNLGVAIGSDVQAWDTNLDQVAALTPTDSNFIVGNGTAWVAESGATALTSLGITAAGQALLDDASASAQRTTLGLTEAIVTTSIASQAEAEAGTNTTNLMTPQRVSQAITALAPDNSLGSGQTWQNVAGSRSVSTSYQNTTGRSIEVAIRGSSANACSMQVSSDNATWISVGQLGGFGNTTFYTSSHITVPDTWYYRTDGAGLSIVNWAELR